MDDYMRQSGTSDYGAAFAHARRNRSDLFADRQDPMRLVPAANFNPNHDEETGQFTSGDGAEGGTAQKGKTPSVKPYDHKLSAHPYKQAQATGECSAAVLCEAAAQVSRMTGDEVSMSINAAKNAIRAARPDKNLDFSSAGSQGAPSVGDVAAALRNQGVNTDDSLAVWDKSDRSKLGQIASQLDNGPVMVAVNRGDRNEHLELITRKTAMGRILRTIR